MIDPAWLLLIKVTPAIQTYADKETTENYVDAIAEVQAKKSNVVSFYA